jgi:hypothetical protein
VGLLLILAGKTAVTSHIRIEDCCELSFHPAMLTHGIEAWFRKQFKKQTKSESY